MAEYPVSLWDVANGLVESMSSTDPLYVHLCFNGLVCSTIVAEKENDFFYIFSEDCGDITKKDKMIICIEMKLIL